LENIALYILERVSATIIEENMLKELILWLEKQITS
jgi:hypothetical protein